MSKKKTLDSGFIARAVAGVRFAFSGNGDWFGAGKPQEAVAPESAKGRQFDYAPFINIGHSKPRENEAISFEQLRFLADNFDVLRLVIEKRKDQLEALDWTIQHRDLSATGANEGQIKDRRIDEAIAFFRRPDKEHGWHEWLRMLLEDLFVIDAPVIYPRKTLGGDLYALELMDGATIKRVLDDTGRTPMPPEIAYQQVLRGLPAVSYTADELLYRPRNNRTYKIYGYSPVEQIIMTVNIALRRQSHALEYYQSGSVPDALVGVPDTWTPEDIRRFQEYWDWLISGESAERRKMRFVAGDLARNFVETKQPPLKDLYDEWLARVVCFCFSIEPTPFVSQVNRATAETSREQSLSDGLTPLKNWVKAIIDDVLARYMGMADFEFIWSENEALNAQEQATIYATYINAGVLTVDEVRAELGRDPLPENAQENGSKQKDGGEDKPEQDKRPSENESEAKKLGKAKRPISEDEAAALIEAFLNEQADDVAEQIYALLQDLDIDFNAEDLQAELNRVADLVSGSLDFAKWAALVAIMAPILQEIAQQAAHKALIDVIAKPAIGMGTAIRSRAVAWANERAAEMVGMKWIEGKLIQNPNAEWQITEGTRDMIRQAVKEAMTHGDSPQQLASRLKQSHAFSKWRSQTIARTEMARADGMGDYIGWSESGLVAGKQWHTCEDDKVSPICNANADVGVIGLHEAFPSGELAPPSHPNCRCTILPVLKEDLGKAYNPNQPRDKHVK